MIASTPFTAVQEPAAAKSTGPWELAELCLKHTAEAVREVHAATPTELNEAIATVREAHSGGSPCDLLEILARVQGHGEEHISPAILELGNKVAAAVVPYAPLIPFAGKLIAPSAFYESFDGIHRIARALFTPVVYAEDTDAIGVASVNPIAASILADEIRNAVFKRFGIRPFVTTARLDYEAWTFLARKHFEL